MTLQNVLSKLRCHGRVLPNESQGLISNYLNNFPFLACWEKGWGKGDRLLFADNLNVIDTTIPQASRYSRHESVILSLNKVACPLFPNNLDIQYQFPYILRVKNRLFIKADGNKKCDAKSPLPPFAKGEKIGYLYMDKPDKSASVQHMIAKVINTVDARQAKLGKNAPMPTGPLFTFLLGAGFSVTAGVPDVRHLVSALEYFRKKPKTPWQEIFDFTSDRSYGPVTLDWSRTYGILFPDHGKGSSSPAGTS